MAEEKLKKVKQAHNLTHEQMEELHVKQIHGDVKTIPANNAGDNIKDEYFKKEYSDYAIPEHEAHIYHIATESRMFKTNSATPEKISNASVQTLTKEMFAFMLKNGAFNGLITHILHDPTKVSLPKDEGSVDGKEGDENLGSAPGNASGLTDEELEALTVAELKDLFVELTDENPKATKKADIIAEIKSLPPKQ